MKRDYYKFIISTDKKITAEFYAWFTDDEAAYKFCIEMETDQDVYSYKLASVVN